MGSKWLHPERRTKLPQPIHSLPTTPFAEIKRQIGKKPPETRKKVFVLKSPRHNPSK